VGGAYGGFASFSEVTGRFAYLSYRDPNLASTLNVYDGAADALAEAEVTDEDCLQTIIGTVADLDSPMTAGKQ
jgi:Zn-dependent M16 (insulinase) family peptidase